MEIEDTDSFLLYLGDVLERIHSTFYSQFSETLGRRDLSAVTDLPTPDLKSIIPELRRSLLRGARLLFTGVIPTNIPPQRSPIWNTARAFGAVVHDKLVPGLASTRPRDAMRATTHVVAGKSGTAKLKEARRVPGVKIVSPRWLWSCAEQWKWLDEQLFPVETDEGGGGREGKKESTRENNRAGDREGTKPTKTEPAVKETPQNSRPNVPGDRVEPSTGDGRRRRDSRISVSDEELERMEAEVEAEMMTSSSSSSDGEEGGVGGNSLERSFEELLSSEQSVAEGLAGSRRGLESRKRKRVEVEDSSCSNSPQSDSELQANSGSSDEEDALAALLTGDS